MTISAHQKGRSSTATTLRAVTLGWLMIGFALGGFFDGILLHQILQWHHLLSGLDEPTGGDVPFQIMMDGLFHLLMYVLALIGTVLVINRSNRERLVGGGDILRWSLVGFSAWHILDAVLSHWLLGIHRIRMDYAQPLLWDLAWLLIFGIVPLLVALRVPSGGGGRNVAAGLLIVTMASGLVAGAGSTLAGPQETIVVFRKNVSQAQMMATVVGAGGSLRWTDASGSVWGISDVSFPGMVKLYAGGAALVSTTPALAGCLAWTRKV